MLYELNFYSPGMRLVTLFGCLIHHFEGGYSYFQQSAWPYLFGYFLHSLVQWLLIAKMCIIQYSGKSWVLGCMNSPATARGSQDAGVTQPSIYLLAEYCTHYTRSPLSNMDSHIGFCWIGADFETTVTTPRTMICNILQPADIGWPTGYGKKLSCSQACCLAQLCLAAALFLSISCGPSYVRRLYSALLNFQCGENLKLIKVIPCYEISLTEAI